MDVGRKIVRTIIPAFFFSAKERRFIEDAIRTAEKNTSGEIRVHMVPSHKGDIMDAAARTFEKLGMTNTAERNGVLIFFSIKDRSFAILGDEGIYKKAGDELWGKAVHAMTARFADNEFAVGISEGVMLIGEALRDHFPYQHDDVNELPDVISFGR